jgi:predicted nucleotidyltransferase component of viral defense system
VTPENLATARLLVEVAPIVFESESFALKGGAAINLFLRDLPRLSVDLDLVLTDHQLSREEALETIRLQLLETKTRLDKRGFVAQLVNTKGTGETKLLVRRGDRAIKVEVNTVIRGSVYPPRRMSLTPIASETLMADLELPLLSPEDVYGGKLVAAMDRQHPRDLFDVMELFAHGGITPAIRRAFVVYLVSHNRPIHEVLFPVPKDIRLAFEGTFSGMTASLVTLDQLLEARRRLFQELPASLDENEREFLRAFTRGEPNCHRNVTPNASAL